MGGRKDDTDNETRRKVLIIILIGVLAVLLVVIVTTAVYMSNSSGGYGRGTSGGGGGGGSSSSSGSAQSEPTQTYREAVAVLSEINGGVLPEISYDDEGIVSFINGKFSDKTVTDYSSALNALYDVRGLLRLSDPRALYMGMDTYNNTYNDEIHKFYKLQQTYNSVPVYGKQLIVETDSIGNTLSLSCDCDPYIDIDTSPAVNMNDARQAAIDLGWENVFSNTLYVYTLKGNDPVLAWGLAVGSDTEEEIVFISAESGNLVDNLTLVQDVMVSASGTDMFGNTKSFEVDGSGSGFTMEDTNRGIYIFDCDNTGLGNPVTSTNNTWDNAAAVSAYTNIRDTIDFYKNRLSSRVFEKGYLAAALVYVNYKPYNCTTDDYYNATSSTTENKKSTLLRIGRGESYARCLDVIAHEYTHSVISASCDLVYFNEAGAINEAYADIIGNLIQEELQGTSSGKEWLMGEQLEGGSIRNLKNPIASRQPDNVNSSYMADYCTSIWETLYNIEPHDHSTICDYGGVHTNSGVINRAAYLMYVMGMTDKTELANLFCRSMDYMVSTSNFTSCRAAVIRAAEAMNLSDDKIEKIGLAFDAVGITCGEPAEEEETEETTEETTEAAAEPAEVTCYITGRVCDAETNEAVAGAAVTARTSVNDNNSNDRRDNSNITVYTDSNGDFTVGLPEENLYNLEISAAGYVSCLIQRIWVSEGETYYLENTILLDSANEGSLGQAGGTVQNAVTGEGVADAQIRFRSMWGNSEGDYVVNSTGGVLTITTNSEGSYYTGALTYGYYTAEVVKDGFITQHTNIIAGSSTGENLNQNILLSPETYGNEFRITLEWDANPRDEDAHITGEIPDEGSFHVYYGNKEDGVGDEVLASLDHDDTSGNGFETITLTTSENGVYNYYVHHYAGTGSLSTSNAKVKVYVGDNMVAQYNVPTDQGTGKYWRVFSIENNEVISVNQIADSAE